MTFPPFTTISVATVFLTTFFLYCCIFKFHYKLFTSQYFLDTSKIRYYQDSGPKSLLGHLCIPSKWFVKVVCSNTM